MAEVTYFVVQPFHRNLETGGIFPGEARQAPSRYAAERAVETLTGDAIGGIAFSRTGDPEIGEWGEAVILKTKGEVVDQSTEEALPW